MGSESASPAKKTNVKPAAASSPTTQPEQPAQLLVNRTPTALLALQRAAGNRAVQRMLKRAAPMIQRNIQLDTGTPTAPNIISVDVNTAFQHLAPHHAAYAALLNWSANTAGYVNAFLRGIDADNVGTLTVDQLHQRVLDKATMFNDFYTGNLGFDWGDSQPNVKVEFLGMIREVYGKSAIMRNLLTQIRGLQGIQTMINELVQDHTGKQLVDSFVNNTINMGDLRFFPENPNASRTWEQTRGEHIIHVLAERYYYVTQQASDMELRYPRQNTNVKAGKFNQAHTHATAMHNQYRQEQGQPQESGHPQQSPGSTTFSYVGGHTQTLTLDPTNKPTGTSFT